MSKYGCTGCEKGFDTFEEALPHHNQIAGHNICSPPIDPCPTCAAMKGKMTVTNITTAILDAGVVIWRSDAESIARAVAYLMEAP